ncbi:MAG: HpcH/HpaI aldolase/citrate lyase family protein, partial [Candidatus Dormibacteraceae bacterium]
MRFQPRSFLFVPGDQKAKMARAGSFGADALILDLEDAVAMDQKPAARQHVHQALVPEAGVDVFVRVNPAGTQWHEDDISSVVCVGLRGVVLPKAESARMVADVDRRIREAEVEARLEPGIVELMVLVETAAGVLHAQEIAAAAPRVVFVAFGAYDFARDLDLRLTPSGEELLVPRMAVVMAARAAGRTPIDTVFADLQDTAAFAEDCRRARNLGFAGKMAIHPNQVATIHLHFSPSKK